MELSKHPLVVCEDGAQRRFHGSGSTGFVYVHGVRVYGQLTSGRSVYNPNTQSYEPTPASFSASGKHAWLVQPAPSAAELAATPESASV